MAFSRTARIWTLLIIDTLFLLIELVVGYAVRPLVVPYEICLTEILRLGWLTCLGGRCLPHAQVSRSALFNDVYSPSYSDVLSLMVALYAIKVRYLGLT
jgi:hypothetical protein